LSEISLIWVKIMKIIAERSEIAIDDVDRRDREADQLIERRAEQPDEPPLVIDGCVLPRLPPYAGPRFAP
jgi:hypothetical protein